MTPPPAKPAPVVALVKGGLGNQMFCYAAGRALALKHGRDLLLDTVTGFHRDRYQRAYRLDRFPIFATEAGPECCLGGSTRSWRHRLARAVSKMMPPSRAGYIIEAADGAAQLDKLRPPPERTVYLNGYWQDERCFAAVADRIRHELVPPLPTSASGLAARHRILSATAPVMLHIRRHQYTSRLDATYYIRAIADCLKSERHARFFVFGDDLDWAREQIDFCGAEADFLDHPGSDEIEDLHLMTCCRHAIVANSSFSWWGAWLGHWAGQKVWTAAHPGVKIRPSAAWIPTANELETG